MSGAPQPPFDLPEWANAWEVRVAHDGWQPAAADTPHRCRAIIDGRTRRTCRAQPVCSLVRGRSGRWFYCAEHAADYRRWVDDGVVWQALARSVTQAQVDADPRLLVPNVSHRPATV